MRRYLEAYQKTNLETAPRGDILVALFDGAVRFTAQAHDATQRKDPNAKGIAVNRAMAILAELTGTLNPKQAPELCGDLAQLYSYLMRRMQLAGATMDPAGFEEVLTHLRSLRETWQEAVNKARLDGYKV